MRILHLMMNEKFAKDISGFYEAFFKEGHDICYIVSEDSKAPLPMPSIPHFVFKKSARFGWSKLINICKEYDYVVLHSLFLPYSFWVATMVSGIFKRMVWIEWGYDLYDWKPRGRFRFFTSIFQKFLRTHLRYLICIFEPDVDFFHKTFPSARAKVFYAPYIGKELPSFYGEYKPGSHLERTLAEKAPIYIQVGHSASSSIDHFRSLKLLSRFKDRNIKIFLPLSYGGAENAKKIKDYAKSLFGEDKLIILDSFVNENEYFKLLDKIDIAIFDTQRQIALGNISRLIYQNAKVYLTGDSILYLYFSKNGVPVQTVESIEKMSFQDFCQPVRPICNKVFSEFIESFADYDSKLACWKIIYGYLEKQLKE